MSRKDFLFLLLSSLAVLGFGKRASGSAGTGKGGGTVIRPPAALKEPEFINRCIRCGNCMKVCPTNGLQPSLLESGLEGIWTPQLVSEIGYCEYNCTLCGNVCPTGAIKKVSQEEKHRVKLGIAEINRSICLAWASNLECIVCEEHCPVADKAVKLVEDKWNGKIIYKPYVDKELCVGCGICQNKCPARPQRAIKVSPEGETRA
jgi:formate hydrogenlyase subunit 6/NADH:ubiquinone oxidoreductase subunit I